MNTTTALFLLNKEFQLVSANKRAKEVFDSHFEKASSFKNAFPDVYQYKILDGLRAALQGRMTQMEYENAEISGCFSFSPVLNENGDIGNISIVFSEEKIHHSELEIQLKSVVEHSSMAIFLTEPSGGILETNKTAREMFGLTLQEFQERGRGGIFVQEKALEDALKIREERGEVKAELNGIHKNGTVFPCEVHSVIYRNHLGELRTSTGIIDISERKKQEEIAANNREAFESLFQHNPDAVYSFDLDGNFINANQNSAKLAETSMEELLKISFLPLIDKKDIDKVLSHFQKAANGEIQQYTTGFVSFKGTQKMLHVTNFPIYINNEIKGIYGIAKDITAQLTAETRILEERNMLRAIIDNIPDYIFVNDTQHKAILTNRRFYKDFLNFDTEEASIGLSAFDYYQKPEALDIISDNQKVMDTGQPVINREDLVQTKGGATETVLLTKVPLTDAQNNITGLVGIARNISELKKNKQELENLNKQLEIRAAELTLSNRELEEFAYSASHDLQEPLRMITGFLNLLDERYAGDIDEKGRKYIHFAHDGAIRMRQIILDLLEYSRAGRLKSKAENIDLNQLIDDILRLHRKNINEKNAKINFDRLPVIYAEKTPLRQVFTNLISNALKYHKSGESPEIDIKFEEQANCYKFYVIDKGIGIEEEFSDKIFVIFQRLHSRDEYSGTGLGLSICKKIVENMEGEIGVDSTPGKGSIFYFSIKKQK